MGSFFIAIHLEISLFQNGNSFLAALRVYFRFFFESFLVAGFKELLFRLPRRAVRQRIRWQFLHRLCERHHIAVGSAMVCFCQSSSYDFHFIYFVSIVLSSSSVIFPIQFLNDFPFIVVFSNF